MTEVRDLQEAAKRLRDEERPSRADQFNSKLLSFADLLDLPPPEPLVEDLLDRDTLAVPYGPSGSGKSFLALDIGWCVAGNLPWQGRQVHGGRVLYVLGEGKGGIGKRARAWIIGHGADQPKDFHLYPQAVNLLNLDQVATLVEWAAAHQPVLVVLDTLARSMPGGDENTGRDMSVAIEAADAIRRACGACVVLIHHTGKDGQLERGHSSLRAAVETMIPVKAQGRIVTVGGGDTKRKDSDPDVNIVLELVPVDLGDGTSSCVLRAFGRLQERSVTEQRKTAVLAAITGDFATTGASNKILREALDLDDAQVSRAVNALVKDGKIHNEGAKTRTLWKPGAA